MQINHPDDFEEACRYDEAIRHGLPKMRGEGYLHDSLKPLRSIDFAARVAERKGGLQFSPGCGSVECRT